MDYLLGNKEVFAIEIDTYPINIQKSKLRLWIQGKPLGSYKKKHKLSFAIFSLRDISLIKGDFYDSSFEQKSAKDIFATCIINKEIEDLTEEDFRQIEKYQKFGIFLGDQFNDTTCLVYIKNSIIHFVWTVINRLESTSNDYFKKINEATVHHSEFRKVVQMFLSATCSAGNVSD